MKTPFTDGDRARFWAKVRHAATTMRPSRLVAGAGARAVRATEPVHMPPTGRARRSKRRSRPSTVPERSTSGGGPCPSRW